MRGQGQRVRPDTSYGEAPERICFMDPQLRLPHDHLGLDPASCRVFTPPDPLPGRILVSPLLLSCLLSLEANALGHGGAGTREGGS